MICDDEMLKRLDDLKISGRADGQSLDEATNAVMAYRGAYRVRLALVGRRLPAVVDAIMDDLERKALAAIDQAYGPEPEEMLAAATTILEALKEPFAAIPDVRPMPGGVIEAIADALDALVEAADRASREVAA